MSDPMNECGHEAANERACRGAAAAHGLTIEQADTCNDREHRCPTCPFAQREVKVDPKIEASDERAIRDQLRHNDVLQVQGLLR